MTITCPICELNLKISPYPVDKRAIGDQPCLLCTKVGTFDGELMTARVRMIVGLPGKIDANLRSAGVPAHLLTTTWADVSTEARAATPVAEAKEIINGRIPGRVWCRKGADGAAAIICLLRRHVRAWYAEELTRWDGWSPLGKYRKGPS
jgi:hypothetical protein